MQVARVWFTRVALVAGAMLGLATVAVAPAAARPAPDVNQAAAKHAFKLTVSPAYTTAGLHTTFEVTVANTSSQGTMLRSVQVTPPTGFTLAHPEPGAPFRRKTLVQKRTQTLRAIALKPGGKVQFIVTATAPTNKCGQSVLRWTSRAFEGATPTGTQLALQPAGNSVGVTVVCPQLAPCGDGGPACSTTETTNVSSYTATSDAGSGTLVGGLDVGKRLLCGGYKPRDPNWYDSVFNAGLTSVSYQIQYTLNDTDPSQIRVCFGLPYEFTTASGTSAGSARLPNGKPGFIGLLPTCGQAQTGPCVISITPTPDPYTNTGFDANVAVQVPAQSPTGAPSGDPWMGP